jgi:hypothetical protein
MLFSASVPFAVKESFLSVLVSVELIVVVQGIHLSLLGRHVRQYFVV